MREQIQTIIKSVCRDLFHIETDIELTRPAPKFGDYSTNIALKLANQLDKSPKEIAEMIARIMNNDSSEIIDQVTVAGPGFINIRLTFSALHSSYSNATVLDKFNKGKLILVESGDADPFKEMHLGHLYNAIEGDTIANILEQSGAKVKRLSYHGDVGLKVAEWVWAVGDSINWDGDKLDSALKDTDLGTFYVEGSKKYKDDEKAANHIREINEQIYKGDHKLINKIYEGGKKRGFEQFETIFKQVNVENEKRYLESETSKVGIETVKKHIGDVFSESQGAIVYEGEKVNLHTRVFINSRGLPTYETKDLGLAEMKAKDYPETNKSIIITGSEQSEYFKVMLAALSEINPKLSEITVHIPHGFLSLTTGKMSSRTGDVYTGKQLLAEVKEAIMKQYPDSKVQDEVFLAAIRYTFLRQRLGNDIVFDVKESVSLEGNSGPYIQYAHARARSILDKADNAGKKIAPELKIDQIPLEDPERYLAMKISEFPEIVKNSTNSFMPHYICIYLYELAQEFNKFYENNRVIDDPRMFTRLYLVKIYAEVLQTGLKLLKIPAPLHM
jgi:arginyl-tRNA synthetase